jgi:hypothetical protein
MDVTQRNAKSNSTCCLLQVEQRFHDDRDRALGEIRMRSTRVSTIPGGVFAKMKFDSMRGQPTGPFVFFIALHLD